MIGGSLVAVTDSIAVVDRGVGSGRGAAVTELLLFLYDVGAG